MRMSILNYAIPPILQLETTTACNLACPFCLRAELCGSDEYLSFDAFRQIIDGTRCRFVTLHGWGEPLMNQDLPRMVRYAAGHRKSVNFTTNATLIHEKVDALLASGLDAIAFSLPDIDRCTPIIAENISRFVAERAKRGQKKPETCINIAIMEENLDQLDRMLAMVRDFGVDTVVFERSFPWTDSLQKKESDMFQGIRDTAGQFGLKVKFPPDHTSPCPLMRYTLFVRWNGDVAPCCYRANVAIGNINSDSMVRIMQNRARFLKSQRSDPVCNSCRV
ncbi:MAG: radical SAM protein [Methanoregula sp.]|uniref:radical SAM protein n=2 Tax=Methanoregula sp. TaxID=2052170 RepID=UPI003BB17A97